MPQRNGQQWAAELAMHLPPAFAAVLRERAEQLRAPRRVSVQVGLASSWQQPGLLLLGDAAHPMSPVRAQGINMALRDSVVAARWLSGAETLAELDAAAAQVEQLRLPEIRRMQGLQSAEARQGHWLGHQAAARWALAGLAPLLGPVAGRIWSARQGPLRQGLAGALPAAELAP
jgi:2-polyprenyl-6-methoxyphenol hydroxylase-like FAD-dependent oxidoreductase